MSELQVGKVDLQPRDGHGWTHDELHAKIRKLEDGLKDSCQLVQDLLKERAAMVNHLEVAERLIDTMETSGDSCRGTDACNCSRCRALRITREVIAKAKGPP